MTADSASVWRSGSQPFYGLWPTSRDSSPPVAPCSAINFLFNIKENNLSLPPAFCYSKQASIVQKWLFTSNEYCICDPLVNVSWYPCRANDTQLRTSGLESIDTNRINRLNIAAIALTQVIFGNSCVLVITVLIDRCFWLKF